MTRICIICRNPQTDFNEEHVFPKAIGGSLIINLVCTSCNSSLGKKVDNPFLRQNVIAHYRNTLNIGRIDKTGRMRNIPNPLSGRRKNGEGKNYIIEYQNGNPVSRLLPDYSEEPVMTENGLTAKIQFDNKFVSDIDKIIKKYAQSHGIPVENIEQSGYKIEKVSNGSSQQIEIPFEFDPFTLGIIKIAYEFVNGFMPEYFDDPFAKLFSSMLINGQLDIDNDRLYKNEELYKACLPYLKRIHKLPIECHSIMIISLKGFGLVAIVRVFNLTHALLMSEDMTYLKSDQLFMINDSIKQNWWMNMTMKLVRFNITIDSKLSKEFPKGFHPKMTLETINGKYPVYDKERTKLFDHLDGFESVADIANYVLLESENRLLRSIFIADGYYVRNDSRELLLPLSRVDLIYDMKY